MHHSSPLARIAVGSTFFAIFAFSASAAMAHTTIEAHLKNTHPDKKMKCTVHRTIKHNGKDVTSLLKTWHVAAKKDQPSSQQNKAKVFKLRVRNYGRTITRKKVYPKLRLTCEIIGQNSKQHTPMWDNNDKSFSTYRFNGSCRSGAYCSMTIVRK